MGGVSKASSDWRSDGPLGSNPAGALPNGQGRGWFLGPARLACQTVSRFQQCPLLV